MCTGGGRGEGVLGRGGVVCVCVGGGSGRYRFSDLTMQMYFMQLFLRYVAKNKSLFKCYSLESRIVFKEKRKKSNNSHNNWWIFHLKLKLIFIL